MPKFFVHPFLFSPLLSLLFCLWKKVEGGNRREQPSQELRPAHLLLEAQPHPPILNPSPLDRSPSLDPLLPPSAATTRIELGREAPCARSPRRLHRENPAPDLLLAALGAAPPDLPVALVDDQRCPCSLPSSASSPPHGAAPGLPRPPSAPLLHPSFAPPPSPATTTSHRPPWSSHGRRALFRVASTWIRPNHQGAEPPRAASSPRLPPLHHAGLRSRCRRPHRRPSMVASAVCSAVPAPCCLLGCRTVAVRLQPRDRSPPPTSSRSGWPPPPLPFLAGTDSGGPSPSELTSTAGHPRSLRSSAAAALLLHRSPSPAGGHARARVDSVCGGPIRQQPHATHHSSPSSLDLHHACYLSTDLGLAHGEAIPSASFFPFHCWAGQFQPMNVFFSPGRFVLYLRFYCFTEKSLGNMHIITPNWCIGLK